MAVHVGFRGSGQGDSHAILGEVYGGLVWGCDWVVGDCGR